MTLPAFCNAPLGLYSWIVVGALRRERWDGARQNEACPPWHGNRGGGHDGAKAEVYSGNRRLRPSCRARDLVCSGSCPITRLRPVSCMFSPWPARGRDGSSSAHAGLASWIPGKKAGR